MTDETLAEALRKENELLRRRFAHHTRPKGPLTLEQARELAERMSGGACEDERNALSTLGAPLASQVSKVTFHKDGKGNCKDSISFEFKED